MHCNTEQECSQLAKMLPPTEAALLDWAINLMADVVEHEHYNKMNARNIAMVFAPNMTQVLKDFPCLREFTYAKSSIYIHSCGYLNFMLPFENRSTLINKHENSDLQGCMYI